MNAAKLKKKCNITFETLCSTQYKFDSIYVYILSCVKFSDCVFFPVLSELIDNMAQKLQASLGVEEFSSFCIPTQVSLLFLKCAASTCYLQTHDNIYLQIIVSSTQN